LSVIPGVDFAASAAAAVLESWEASAEDILESLVDMALPETPAAGRYAFHDLIRLFAREYLAAEPDARDAALDRVLGARAANQLGDVPREVHSTILLAEKMAARGKAAETLELYERCLLLTDQADDPGMRVWALVHNGDTLRELGEAERARNAYEEALEINESLTRRSACTGRRSRSPTNRAIPVSWPGYRRICAGR